MQHTQGTGFSIGSGVGTFEPQAGPGSTDRLFFALFPDAATAARLAESGAALRRQHGLRGPVQAPDRLHVTLNHVGEFSPLPPDLVGAAKAAGDRLRSPPVPVRFPVAGSFGGRSSNLPFVLRGGEHDALRQLQSALTDALLATRTIRAREAFEPHMTLLYDRQLVADVAVEPIAWTAADVVLVHSLVGQASYRVLQRWRLAG